MEELCIIGQGGINVYDDKGEKRTGRGRLQGREPFLKKVSSFLSILNLAVYMWMWRMGKVLGWRSLGGWFAPLLCCLVFSIYGVSYVKLGRCIFFSCRPSVAFSTAWDYIQRQAWCTGPYAGVDYNLTLCQLQSRLQHSLRLSLRETWCMGIGQPYTRVDLYPMAESTKSHSQEFGIWPLLSLYNAAIFIHNKHAQRFILCRFRFVSIHVLTKSYRYIWDLSQLLLL